MAFLRKKGRTNQWTLLHSKSHPRHKWAKMPQITTDSFRQQLCAVFTEYPWLAIQQSLREEVRKGQRAQLSIDHDKLQLTITASHVHRPGILWMAEKLRPGKCSHFWLYDDYGNGDIFFSYHILNSEVSDYSSSFTHEDEFTLRGEKWI